MQSKKKPAKPYPHFPLFAHASGKWAKKISDKIEYDLPPKDCTIVSERILLTMVQLDRSGKVNKEYKNEWAYSGRPFQTTPRKQYDTGLG
jgi:hypothetical protein